MTWHRALLLALLLVGIGSVPVDAVNLHVGTGRALLSGDGSGGGGGAGCSPNKLDFSKACNSQYLF